MFLLGTVKQINLRDDKPDELYSIQCYLQGIVNKPITAYPYDLSSKNIPLINETVLLVQAQSATASPDERQQNKTYYYLNPLSLQQSVHNNALVGSKDVVTPDTISDYLSVQNGLANVSTKTVPNLGDGFEERTDINSLQPYIGDVLFEGRFGHSLRFGYSPKNPNTTKQINWSSNKASDPITILSNGRNGNSPAKFIVEDVNKDLSSIYLTSSQKIKLKPSHNFSLGVTPPNNYTKPQIIFNSDRIILNSKTDSVLISGNKSVNISTPNWKADMDKMFTILEKLIEQLADLTSGVATFATSTGGVTAAATNVAQVQQLLTELKQMSQ